VAFIECQFFSETLDLSCSMHVILPQALRKKGGTPGQRPPKGYPTLYLLHGLSDDHTIWTRHTSIERYVENMNLAVVMPAVGRSFYTDMKSGMAYGKFIADELPMITRSLFPLSDAREDNFVAGLSMGGYGAFKLALTYPERFAAAASLSGAVDMLHRAIQEEANPAGELRRIFGAPQDMPSNGHDLFALADSLADRLDACPQLFQCCGTEDFLIEDNERFAAHAQALGLPLRYITGPGEHVWGYWDVLIQQVLNWLPVSSLYPKAQ